MKTEIRLSGIFASVGFLGAVILSYGTDNPLWMLIYGMVTAIVLGFLGYRIGYIVSHPRGKKRRRGGKTRQPTASGAIETPSAQSSSAVSASPPDSNVATASSRIEEALPGESPV